MIALLYVIGGTNMIDFGIPGDSIKLRRKVFSQMITPDDKTGYVDGATDYCLLQPFAKAFNLSTESRLWAAFLYGMSYSCTTTMRFVMEFPTVEKLSPKKVKRFWTDNKETLWFQPDKKYLKNNDQVVPAIKSIYQLSNFFGDLKSYLIPLLDQGFDATYKDILKRWKYFGPHGAYLFFDALYGLCPSYYSDPEDLDWKNCGKTVPEGMAHLLGLDEQALHKEPFDIPRYSKNVTLIAKRFNQPKIIVESTLCAFRKLFKGTRYVGYYADRQLAECFATEDILSHEYGIDIWKYREQSVPKQLRGEILGWDGIRKQKCKDFLSTGEVL